MKKEFLDFELAVEKSLKNAKATTFTEIVNIEDALNRIIAKDIVCNKNLPSFNNSAMDGFAVKFLDAGKSLKVRKIIFAGEKVEACLDANECYKIMTGAQVPSDADTIIPIEDVVSFEDDIVTIPENIKKGSSLRLKGEEKAIDDILFKKGETINSSTLAVLASQGITKITVYKKISIAVVSTGNELKEPWEEASDDEIYNCNSYAISTLLEEKGFDSTYIGVIPDNLEQSIEFISNLSCYDVVITTGGISMGDADFMADAFKQNGLKTIFHGVNIKPGRPIMMGVIEKELNNCFVMCLPGNPLTAMVNMHLFAIPVLNKIQGGSSIYQDICLSVNKENFKTKTGRVNVVLGTVKNGEFKVTKKNKYGSGMITVLNESNAIVVTKPTRDTTTEGEFLRVIRFSCSYLETKTEIFN